MSGQRGQALVGVLVILTLILLLAGSVALGASTLVAGERQPDNAVVDDLTVQSSVAGSVARMATNQALCPTPTSTSFTVRSSQAFTLQLPPAAPGKRTTVAPVYCVGVAQPGTGSPALINPTALPNGCWSADLSGAGTNGWSVLFDARWPAGGSAFVAAGAQSGCPKPAGQKCLVPVPSTTSPITQLAMLCSTTNLSRPTLFVIGAQAVGQVVALASGPEPDNGGGAGAVFYLLAANTGSQQPGRDYEEGLVLAQPHSSLQLQYEGPMR
jgi:hypothetical protein